MIMNHVSDSGGKCFAWARGCCLLTEASERCNTYGCPFYKPQGCKDWIRRDSQRGYVYMIAPEEVKYVYMHELRV